MTSMSIYIMTSEAINCRHTFLIGIDFWKSLFSYVKDSSGVDQVYDVYFKKRKFVYSLEGFNVASANAVSANDGLRGYLQISEISDLMGIECKCKMKVGELLVVVYPEWKRFRVSYQILRYCDESEGLVGVTKVVNVDLRAYLDQDSLLEYSGKNNLELMKIRLAPEIALPKIYDLRVTIIGTGTLGCNIARGLLAWGVERLTFVDNNTVSASNLLRQTLFEVSDLGYSKAKAAARRIGQIFPPCKDKVVGVDISIPMPDHVECFDGLEENLDRLENVIEGSDLVFLCTDNRESRWLPTLVAVVKNKPLINLAIGFDSWMVMRHPLVSPQDEVTFTKFLSKPAPNTDVSLKLSSKPIESCGLSITSLGGVCLENREIGSSYGSIECDRDGREDFLRVEQFGCYFCPSVEGVHNSVQYQTEDERCTVTRGGASSLASAYAVELAIGLVNSKRGFYSVGGELATWSRDNSLVKGESPQQLRGSLNNFTVQRCLVKRNSACICCSGMVRQYYEDPTTKLKFLQTVCKDSGYLSIITGADVWTSRVDDLVEDDHEMQVLPSSLFLGEPPLCSVHGP